MKCDVAEPICALFTSPVFMTCLPTSLNRSRRRRGAWYSPGTLAVDHHWRALSNNSLVWPNAPLCEVQGCAALERDTKQKDIRLQIVQSGKRRGFAERIAQRLFEGDLRCRCAPGSKRTGRMVASDNVRPRAKQLGDPAHVPCGRLPGTECRHRTPDLIVPLHRDGWVGPARRIRQILRLGWHHQSSLRRDRAAKGFHHGHRPTGDPSNRLERAMDDQHAPRPHADLLEIAL